MNPLCTRLQPPVLLMAALMLGTGPSVAVSTPWDPDRTAALSAWDWDVPQVFDLAGARVRIWAFRAPLPPADAARRLQQAGASRFDRLQFSGPELSLAGMHAGHHWLAQLRPAPGRVGHTAGLLSSLGPEALHPAGFDPGTLVPPGARALLRASSRMATGTNLIASYLCPGSYRRVALALRRALWAQRWRPLAAANDATPALDAVATAAGEWMQPGGGRLTVHLQARADAVALTLWHRSKESP